MRQEIHKPVHEFLVINIWPLSQYQAYRLVISIYAQGTLNGRTNMECQAAMPDNHMMAVF